MHQRPGYTLAIFLLGMVLLSACDARKKPEIAAQDPTWSSIISARTAGVVSRKSKVRVVFVNDVVGKELVGQDAAGYLKFDPSIKGSASFVSEREILFAPQQDLAQGRYYRAVLNPKGLSGIPERLAAYEFVFQAMAQEFEVTTTGLSTSPDSDKTMILTGALVTADVDEAERVEKVLSATYRGQAVKIDWQHNPDGRRHDYTIAGLERDASNQSVKLAWNGKPIEVDNQGERGIEVPARNVFKVTQVHIARDTQQYIEVFFSDTLDARQNLKGLVRLGGGGFSARVDGNQLKIYPDRGAEGDVAVTIDAGVRNAKGERLAAEFTQTVTFVSEKPKLRFVGKGAILPDNKVLSVPFEAVNLRAVRVTAFRVYENNIGQFLQTNKLDGGNELNRVGRYLWRKTIHLTTPEANKWNRYSIDVSELFRDHPGGLFRLSLSFARADSTFVCPGATPTTVDETEKVPISADDYGAQEYSAWDYAEDYYGENQDDNSWSEREDPCKSAYYRYAQGIKDERNFLASNIGLLAKRDARGHLLIVATDLRNATPLKGVELALMNFQNQQIARLSTNGDGFAELDMKDTPFYISASKDGQKGYLKLSNGAALPTSHFDVGGEQVRAGIKGIIYGERGVWRPGDDIHLTFVLQDRDKKLPPGHPVTMELYNPKGQLMQTLSNSTPVNSFYRFTLKTATEAPTGNWTAKAVIGGTTFSKSLPIETVMPNRLKVELDFGKERLLGSETLKGKLFGQWLSGATAAGLKADVKLKLTPAATHFERNADFVFDDPAREFKSEPEVIFEDTLDDQGRATLSRKLDLDKQAPGMLTAGFTSRVFERGGAFSIARMSLAYSPYDNYVGIKLPKGDQSRDMLLTDKSHAVEIATLSADGKPVSLKSVQVTLYKVDWRWWWDRSGDSLAQYASASHSGVVHQGKIATSNGRGLWNFEIKYPAWGRYLVRACDTEGQHCTGKLFYIDWPGWAGRAREQAGPGASALSFTADKSEYNVGEVAKLQLPEATQGRALVTLESGTRILDQRWIEFGKDRTGFDVPITQGMSPNVYVSVTLIQPHAGKDNDRPIRLYGIIPLKVNDLKTRLSPVVHAPEEWAPESNVAVEVSERDGRAMTYTLAVVDEGLLGLTSYKTPALHDHFYKREALGVNTWDLFDEVAGAYGGELERLLALGGSDAVKAEDLQDDKKRFPPVVRFLGPFELKAQGKNKHDLKLPPYVGAVRVMVIAGQDSAYGSVDKSVYVRQPLMLLATVPRVLGPDEELTVPVSLFVMDKDIRDVKLKIEADQHFEVLGGDTVTVGFTRPEEKLGLLRLKVRSTLGKARLGFVATAGKHQARSEIYIDIRSPNPPTSQYQRKALKPGETWDAQVLPHGLVGTNVVSMEISAVPPLNLERRLQYLIRYPHGCIEQTTSAAFPQIYLPALVKLSDDKKKEVERYVQAGVDRLRGFQLPNGGFTYWPGGFATAVGYEAYNGWSTNYAGHFLLEAQKQGYQIPSGMLVDWARHQKSLAQSWTAGSQRSTLDQTYRLYTLALAGQPELGAMNRLRESGRLSVAERWQLAAAYKLAGVNDAAQDLVKGSGVEVGDYAQPDYTFGSRVRDAAIVLNSMLILDRLDQAKPVVELISAELASEGWYSTQSVAFSLLAMAQFTGAREVAAFGFERQIGDAKIEKLKTGAPVYTAELAGIAQSGTTVKLRNTSDRNLFASIVVRGVSKAGEEKESAAGLEIDVKYIDSDGNTIDSTRLRQGADLVAQVSVHNSGNAQIDNLALTQILPSGWEIHNARLDNAQGSAALALVDYEDIRDDRVYRYFSLKSGETKRFTTQLNASYLGRYYLPALSVEAMYDASKQARTRGLWVEVVK